MKYDIVTFGSAIEDTFLRLKKESYQIWQEKGLPWVKTLCFPLGHKIFIEDTAVASGGGATNTACTFSNQGFKVAVCSMIGHDKKGEMVMEELEKFRVATKFIKKDKNYPTASSVILSAPREERTILIYRGACHFMQENDIPWQKLPKVKWFYLAPLSGETAKIFGPLVKFAREQGIKIAANPGNSQLNLGLEALKPTLSQIDVLILNLEEASLLTEISPRDEEKVIEKLTSLSSGLVVITKGKEGSVVGDGKNLYQASTPNVLPFEKTGAGDAYASGFLSGLLEKNDIRYAIQLATANAASCIHKTGAKNGLLKKGQWGSWPRVEVTKRLFLK